VNSVKFEEQRNRDKNIVIRRRDIERVHDWARESCKLRDFLLIRVIMKIGLRNSELRMLRIEDVNFEDRTFQVLDSKKYELFPLPLDVLTLQLIKDLVGDRKEGLVFQHTTWQYQRCDQPLSKVEIWHVVHDIGEKAGVKGLSPRLLRHYFACHWIYVEKKSLVTLQRLMRHNNIATTFFYTKRLIFFEDMQREYDGVRNGPFIEFEKEVNVKVSEGSPQVQIPAEQQPTFSLEESICKVCSNLHLCKFQPLPACATHCKFKVVKLEGIRQYH